MVRLELGQVEVRPAAARARARRRCGTGTARRRTGTPRSARRRPARATRPGASRAAGRRACAARSPSRYDLPSGESNASVPRTASISAACPPTTFAQVGDSASSRSAMNTRAPELSALIIIFGSAGPVISTRRSSRSAGAGATVQSASRIVARAGQEVEPIRRHRAPPVARARRWRRSSAERPEAALQVGDERERLVGQDALGRRRPAGPVTTTPGGGHQVSPPRDGPSPR